MCHHVCMSSLWQRDVKVFPECISQKNDNTFFFTTCSHRRIYLGPAFVAQYDSTGYDMSHVWPYYSKLLPTCANGVAYRELWTGTA